MSRQNEIFESEKPQHSLLTFEVPSIEAPIPSNGVVYPETSPLHMKQYVEIKQMTTTQENILTNRLLLKQGTMLTKLIESCLVDKTINVKEMLIGDRNTIMVQLRISGYLTDYEAEITCPSCDKKTKHVFDLGKLPIKRLSLQPVKTGMNLFEYVLPQTKAKVMFKFPVCSDEIELTAINTQKKKAGLPTEVELITTSLLENIVSINGVSDRAQITSAIPKIPAFDSNSLRKHIQNNEPGIQLVGPFKCTNELCEFESEEVKIPLGPNFFWPNA